MLRTDKTIIDSRTIILLLLSCNVVTFTQQNFYIELGMWLFLAIIMIVSGCAKQLIKWAAILIGIMVLETYILPSISIFNFGIPKISYSKCHSNTICSDNSLYSFPQNGI